MTSCCTEPLELYKHLSWQISCLHIFVCYCAKTFFEKKISFSLWKIRFLSTFRYVMIKILLFFLYLECFFVAFSLVSISIFMKFIWRTSNLSRGADKCILHLLCLIEIFHILFFLINDTIIIRNYGTKILNILNTHALFIHKQK